MKICCSNSILGQNCDVHANRPELFETTQRLFSMAIETHLPFSKRPRSFAYTSLAQISRQICCSNGIPNQNCGVHFHRPELFEKNTTPVFPGYWDARDVDWMRQNTGKLYLHITCSTYGWARVGGWVVVSLSWDITLYPFLYSSVGMKAVMLLLVLQFIQSKWPIWNRTQRWHIFRMQLDGLGALSQYYELCEAKGKIFPKKQGEYFQYPLT